MIDVRERLLNGDREDKTNRMALEQRGQLTHENSGRSGLNLDQKSSADEVDDETVDRHFKLDITFPVPKLQGGVKWFLI